jgi:hypothetical protein
MANRSLSRPRRLRTSGGRFNTPTTGPDASDTPLQSVKIRTVSVDDFKSPRSRFSRCEECERRPSAFRSGILDAPQRLSTVLCCSVIDGNTLSTDSRRFSACRGYSRRITVKYGADHPRRCLPWRARSCDAFGAGSQIGTYARHIRGGNKTGKRPLPVEAYLSERRSSRSRDPGDDGRRDR